MIRNAFKIAGWTLLSRLSGFCRDVLIAKFIGAGGSSDSFFLALMLPNFFRRFFAEGAFNSVFIPQFSRIKAKTLSEAQVYVSTIFTLLLGIILILVGLFEWFAPFIIRALAPGFQSTPERLQETIHIARIMFPYIFFITFANALGGILNSFGKFSEASAMPLVFNICMMGGLVLLSPFVPTPGYALASGVIVSGVLQVLWLYSKSFSIFPVKWRKIQKNADVTFFLRNFVIASLGASVTHVITLLNAFFASWLPQGTLSYLFYADRLAQLPLSILGIALSTALLPSLSQAIQAGNESERQFLQNRTFFLATFLSFPAAVGLFCLAHPIIHILFERGAFGAYETLQTTWVLKGYALGVPAYVLSKVLNTCFFARQDPKTPLRASILFVSVHALSTFCFYKQWGAFGISISLTLGSWANVLILMWMLARRNWLCLFQGWWKVLIKIIIATVVMGAFLIFFTFLIAKYGKDTLNFGDLILQIIAGSGIFLGCTLLLRVISREVMRESVRKASCYVKGKRRKQ